MPYPKEGEEDTLLICHDFGKKQKNEGSTTDIKSAQQTSEDKRDLPGCDFENSSSCNANKEFSAPRLDLDSWPDLPSISAALSKGYNDENNESSLQAGLMDFSEASNLNSVRGNTRIFAIMFCNHHTIYLSLKESCSFSTRGTVQLEGNHELFNNEHDDREDDSFLDCDWANMGDFDDLDKIFR